MMVACVIGYWFYSYLQKGKTDVPALNGRHSVSGDLILYPDFWKAGSGVCDGNVSIWTVVAVVSHATNFDSRSVIRRTWGGRIAERNGYRLIFVLALPETGKVQVKIDKEDVAERDIVQLNYVDVYDKLTVKSTSILRWVHRYCGNAKYVLKIDDDSFLNPELFHQFLLRQLQNEEKAIYGLCWSNGRPVRNPHRKWYLSLSDFPDSRFPDYVDGPAYLVSGSAVPDLIAAFDSVWFIPLEDVFVTGLCATYANVRRIHVPQFLSLGPPTFCSVLRHIVVHNINVTEVDRFWSLLLIAASSASTLEQCPET